MTDSGEKGRTGKCPVCGGRFRITAAEEVRVHGKPANRCPGSGADPGPSILVSTDEWECAPFGPWGLS